MSKFYLPRHRPGLLGHRRRCLTSPGAAELVPPGHGLDRRRAGLRCGYDPRRREPDAVSARLNHSRTAGRGAACCPPLLRANFQVAPGAQPSIGVGPDTPVEASLATTPQVPSRSSRLATPALHRPAPWQARRSLARLLARTARAAQPACCSCMRPCGGFRHLRAQQPAAGNPCSGTPRAPRLRPLLPGRLA